MKELNIINIPSCSKHPITSKEAPPHANAASVPPETNLSALLGIFIIIMALLFIICLFSIKNHGIIFASITFFALGVFFSILLLGFSGLCIKRKNKKNTPLK